MSLQATIRLADAATCSWDTIVVGAGPAGSLAAYELARQGAKVLLVDKASFPRWKVCGSCINGRALGILRAAGLGEMSGRLRAVALGSLWLCSAKRRAVVPLPDGVVLSRERFDAALIEAAVDAGVDFLPGTRARLGPVLAEARMVVLQQESSDARVASSIVLAADGIAGSLLARQPERRVPRQSNSWIGAGAIVRSGPDAYRPGTIFMACGSGGYAGVVRLEDGRLDVAAATSPNLVKQVGHPSGVVHGRG